MQAVAIALNPMPTRIADLVAGLLARLTIPDLSRRRLGRPRSNLYTRVARDHSVPVHDNGIVELLGSGRVSPVPAAVSFLPDAVRLADGSLMHPDAVVFATGYRRGLQELLAGLDLLDAHGDPRAPSGTAAAPGLYFVGFSVTATGALRQLAMDARHVARAESRDRKRKVHLRRAGTTRRKALPLTTPLTPTEGSDFHDRRIHPASGTGQRHATALRERRAGRPPGPAAGMAEDLVAIPQDQARPA